MNKVRFLVVLIILVLGLQLINFVPAQTVIGPAPGPDITFTADPTTIAKGDSSRLTWSSPSASSCKFVRDFWFDESIPTSGSKVVTPSSDTTYKMYCTNNSGTRNAEVTVRVARCPSGNACHGETIDIKINGSDGPVRFSSLPVTFSGEITLTSTDPWWAVFSPDPIECIDWTSQSILYLLGFGGTTYHKEVTLSASESNYGLHIYPVTCNFDIGGDSIRDSVDVIIERPSATPTLTLTANPTSIIQGQSTKVEWTSTNTTSCTGSRGGSYPTSGSFTDSPSSTTSYGMTCTGTGGSVTKSVTVTVGAVAAKPILTFFANPSSIIRGSSSTLSWSASNATSCSASGGWSGSKSTSGSQSVSPSSTTKYTLTCTGPGGSDSKDATVTVGASVPGATLPSVDIKGQ